MCHFLYRKLAQVHHPDKSTKANKEANEAIFMEIAAAYEVLSDEDQREEYDALRAARGRASRGGNGRTHDQQQRYQYQDYQEEARRQYQEYQREYFEQQRQQYENYHQQQQEYYQRQHQRQQQAFQRAYEEYMEEMEAANSHNNFGPVFTGAFYPSGSVILPYNPIIVSAERSHFALLDLNCTLAVYRGNPDELMSYLLRADNLDLSDIPYFKELYKSDIKLILLLHLLYRVNVLQALMTLV